MQRLMTLAFENSLQKLNQTEKKSIKKILLTLQGTPLLSASAASGMGKIIEKVRDTCAHASATLEKIFETQQSSATTNHPILFANGSRLFAAGWAKAGADFF